MSGSSVKIAPGRTCANCTLCCKIMGIKELAKPRNQECPNCDIGKGCNVYATRPQSCRDFNCLYLRDETLGEHWRPADAHMVLTHYEANRLCVHVDPAHPDVWRHEPYYSDLKRWASTAAQSRAMIAVYVGDHLTIVLPDRDKAFGMVGDDTRMRFVTRGTPFGVEYDVELVGRA